MVGANTVLAERYRLIKPLGQGGMGTVWRAEHVTLGSLVAVKLMDATIALSEDAMLRFQREAKSAAALRSPHVVQILDYGVDNGTPYIAMEMLEGESLADRLKAVGKLSIEETARVMTDVARAVARAHEMGVIHRDLKPDNIYLVKNDDHEIAKVLDFGIAKRVGPGSVTSQTRTGAVIGTPFYMSPEQAEGVKTIDHRTDLWSMGVIVYECLLGLTPFQSESLGELVLKICARPIPIPSEQGTVPPGFDAWFAKGCARDPDERYGDARELARDLRAVAGLQGRDPLGSLPEIVVPEKIEVAIVPEQAGFRTTAGVTANTDATPASTVRGPNKKFKLIAASIGGALALVIVGLIAGRLTMSGAEPSMGVIAAESVDPAVEREVPGPAASIVPSPASSEAQPDAGVKEDGGSAINIDELPVAEMDTKSGGASATARPRPTAATPASPKRATDTKAPAPKENTPPPSDGAAPAKKKRNYGF